jgi:GTP-binding protein EngB required for normal cell division
MKVFQFDGVVIGDSNVGKKALLNAIGKGN